MASRVAAFGAFLLCLAACQRETRVLTGGTAGPTPTAAPSALRAGGGLAPPPTDPIGAVYEGNAFEISEGQR